MARFCGQCGVELPDGVRFCVECGEAVVESPRANDAEDRPGEELTVQNPAVETPTMDVPTERLEEGPSQEASSDLENPEPQQEDASDEQESEYAAAAAIAHGQSVRPAPTTAPPTAAQTRSTSSEPSQAGFMLAILGFILPPSGRLDSSCPGAESCAQEDKASPTAC